MRLDIYSSNMLMSKRWLSAGTRPQVFALQTLYTQKHYKCYISIISVKNFIISAETPRSSCDCTIKALITIMWFIHNECLEACHSPVDRLLLMVL